MPEACGSTTCPPSRAVKFHAVVVRRIVAGGDHDAGLRARHARGERKLRRGAVLGKKQRVDAERVERLRRGLRELRARNSACRAR